MRDACIEDVVAKTVSPGARGMHCSKKRGVAWEANALPRAVSPSGLLRCHRREQLGSEPSAEPPLLSLHTLCVSD